MKAAVARILLKDELDNIMRQYKRIVLEIESLPKGCITEKRIKGHSYAYLQYRENGKIVSIAVKKNENLEELKLKLLRRKTLKTKERVLKKEIEEISKLLAK